MTAAAEEIGSGLAEALALGKPVLVIENVTRGAGGDCGGAVRVAEIHGERIRRETERRLENERAYAAMARAANPFGDGHASERILAELTGG